MSKFVRPSWSWPRVSFVLLALLSLWMKGGASERVREAAPAPPVGDATAGPWPIAGRPELIHLPPGTRIGPESPPSGWSQLVLKSAPMLKAGDLETVSQEAFATARRIRLVVLADAARASASGPYRLRRVGVGLAAPVVGRDGEAGGDVVVAATHVGDDSGEWSTTGRIVLAAASRELGRATLASTPTFALLRTPTTGLASGSHRTIDVLYAILLDPETGGLRLFACRAAESEGLSAIREVDTPASVDCPLHVKARTIAGIPISWSFAMIDLPDGVEREAPAELASLLAPERLDAPDGGAIERAFREFAERPPIARADHSDAEVGLRGD